MKNYPVLYNKEEECCGCMACYSVCPKEAIYIIKDNEGFSYPKLNKEECICCYLCRKVCPFKESDL